MEGLQIFKNSEFGEIRTIEENGNVLFCGHDIAKSLGYTNTRKAAGDHCKGVTKRDTLTAGGMQPLSFIPEGDVYRLIARSKLPSADRFERWVFDEVLPSIRRHGAYMTGDTLQKALTSPDFLIQLATELKNEQEKRRALEEQTERDKPKVLFADAVSTSKSEILIGDLAKIIKQNGVNIGQNRLFDWMRRKGYLIRQQGTSYNMPTQRSMEMGLVRIKETAITHSDGHVSVSKTVKVLPKGQIYFINKFLKEKEAGQGSADESTEKGVG